MVILGSCIGSLLVDITIYNQSNVFYLKPFSHQQLSKFFTDTQPKTPKGNQKVEADAQWLGKLPGRHRDKKSREKPGSKGWPVFFWLYWVEF